MNFKKESGAVFNHIRGDVNYSVTVNICVETNIQERSLIFSTEIKSKSDENLSYRNMKKESQDNVDWFIKTQLGLFLGIFVNMNFNELNIGFDSSEVEERLDLYESKYKLQTVGLYKDSKIYDDLAVKSSSTRLYFDVDEELMIEIDKALTENIKNIVFMDREVIGADVVDFIRKSIREKKLTRDIASKDKQESSDIKKRKI